MSAAPPVLIVGSYPPLPVAGAPVTVAEVRRAWAAGDEVTVVSPRLSAAHLAVPVYGLLAGRRLDNVRRHTGARRVVLVVEPGFPFPASPALHLPTAVVLARALRGFEHVRIVQAGGWIGLAGRARAMLRSVADEMSVVEAGPAEPGVTPLGPPEVRLSERPRQVAAILARRALGPRAPAVRARLGGLRRRLTGSAPPG